jgi:hypothetical protein
MPYRHKNGKGLAVLLIILLSSQFSCVKKDGYNSIVSGDNSIPGPVTNVKVTNFNGGAYITYDLPASKNILYVQAQYMINQKQSRQTKSSYYSDSITVSGFEKSKDYEVTLNVVSRANVKSDPVVITVHPDTPPYLLLFPSISLNSDFGGVAIKGSNKQKSAVGIVTISPDSTTGKWEIVNQYYTNQDSIAYSLRGYDTIARQFGVYVTDQWNNISDTLFANINPLYEVEMDKSKFQAYTLPSDVIGFQPAPNYGRLSNLWDNNPGEPTYNTDQPITPPRWPVWITFDMGQAARLSRFNMLGRDGGGLYLWSYGTPQTWIIWGRETTPVDEQMPTDTTMLPPLGAATPNGWINMGKFNGPPKPSGLPNNQYTNADYEFWKKGFEYSFSLTLPKVRYIRFECIETMGHTNNYFDINELTFWGDPR